MILIRINQFILNYCNCSEFINLMVVVLFIKHSVSWITLSPNIIVHVQENKLRPPISSKEFFKLSQRADTLCWFLLDSRNNGLNLK